MSVITTFYMGDPVNYNGELITHKEILSYSFFDFEHSHNTIQWLFPTNKPSKYQPSSPLLQIEDVAAFCQRPRMVRNILNSFQFFLAKLGLATLLNDNNDLIIISNFGSDELLREENHNWLRITRVLDCFITINQPTLVEAAEALYMYLVTKQNDGDYDFGKSLSYWNKAIAGKL